jgi:uncharacterized phage protein (TIGR02220 family)
MSKLRSVSTAFWSDPFIEDLTPSEKLLFLYLITNDKTNMLGIYEVSIKKISFDTGLNKDIIEKALKEFERLLKVKYIKNHIVLVNFIKHQNYNTNMKKSAIDIYNALPNELKDNDLNISKDNPLKGFESLLNHYGMVSKYEVEVEVEVETEIEEETKEPIDWQALLDFLNKAVNKKYKSFPEPVKKSYRKRLKEGFNKSDIMKAIEKAAKDEFHISNEYKHLTIEFFSRADKLDKFSQGLIDTGKTNQKFMTYDN